MDIEVNSYFSHVEESMVKFIKVEILTTVLLAF